MSNAASGGQEVSRQVFGEGELSIEPRDENDLRVVITDSDEEALWAGVHEWGFWNSRTETGQIKNEVARRHVQTKAQIEAELDAVWTELADRADEDELFLIPPAIRELLANTEQVVAHSEPEKHYVVSVTAKRNGEPADPRKSFDEPVTRTLTFTEAEWSKNKGDPQRGPPLREKYLNQFHGLLPISWAQWREDVRPAWEEMKESRGSSPKETGQ